MSTALALFDLAALTPADPTQCAWCGTRPATTRVTAVKNLYGTHPAWLGRTRYRDATRTTNSGPCCHPCATYVADAWWGTTTSCGHGACRLWTHTLNQPRPQANCAHHHTERTVVRLAPMEVPA